MPTITVYPSGYDENNSVYKGWLASHPTVDYTEAPSNALYYKNNGSWTQVVAAYKKVNGVWVEQSDLTQVFLSGTNYVKG